VGNLSEAAVGALVGRGLKKIEHGFAWKTDPRLRLPSLRRFTPPEILSTIVRITCPTLIIRAKDGIAFPETEAKLRLSLMKNAELRMVEGHHHVHLDAPHLIAPLIQEFLTRRQVL
jgi:pimeloyl-ACP methyl ester carboxylesterase